MNRFHFLMLCMVTYAVASTAEPAPALPHPGAFLLLEEAGDAGPVWHAYHPASEMSALVSAYATVFRTRDFSTMMVLRGAGRGEMLDDPGPLAGIIATNNALLIDRERISERIENRPEGFKQSYFIHTRPDGDGPLRLEKAIAGDLAIETITTGAIRFTTESGTTILYDALLVMDAAGKKLPARFVPATGGDAFGIEVDDTGALYPVEIDPLFRPERTRPVFIAQNNPFSALIPFDQPGTVIRVDRDLCLVGVPGYRLFPRNTLVSPSQHIHEARRRLIPEVMKGLALDLNKPVPPDFDKPDSIGSGTALLKAFARMMYYAWNDPIEEVGAVFVFRLFQGEWILYDVLQLWDSAVANDMRVTHQGYPQTEQWKARFGAAISISDTGVLIGEPGRASFDYFPYSSIVRRWSGPHISGTAHFYNRPADAAPFFRVPPFQDRIRSSQPMTSFGFEHEFFRYREAGHVVAIGRDYAVVASGPIFNPAEWLSMNSGYGPTKLHHFRREGEQWRRLPDTFAGTQIAIGNDFPGQVIALEIVGLNVFALERQGGTIRLHRYQAFATWPLSPALLGSWEAGGAAKLSARDGRLVLGLPNMNRIYTIEDTGLGWELTPHEAEPGESALGSLVAHGGEFFFTTSQRDGQNHLTHWARTTNGWSRGASEPAPALWDIDADRYTLGMTGPRPGQNQNADLRLRTFNRAIEGVAYRPDGTLLTNAMIRLEGEGLDLPPIGRHLPLNMTPRTEINFYVPEHVAMLDHPLLRLELNQVPTNMFGRRIFAEIELPWQQMTRAGTTNQYLGNPTFGNGGSVYSNGVVEIPLWDTEGYLGRYADEASARNYRLTGEWKVRILAPYGTGNGPFGRIDNATLRLVYGPDRTFGRMDLRGTVFTDTQGRFSFSGLSPGAYRVTTQAQGFKGTSSVLDLDSSFVQTGVRLDTIGALSYEATLTTLAGHPIAGVTVTLGGTQVVSDANGNFTIDGILPDATSTFTLGEPWNFTFSRNFFSWAPSETIRLLPQIPPPAIRVLSASAEPLPGTTIRITGPYGYATNLVTGAQGRIDASQLKPFRINHLNLATRDNVYPGRYTITGVSSGVDWPVGGTSFTLPLADGATNEIIFRAIGSTLALEVVEAGTPVTNGAALVARILSTSITTQRFDRVTGTNSPFRVINDTPALDLGNIRITLGAFDELRELRVHHARQTVGSFPAIDTAPWTYHLIGPDGDELSLGTSASNLVSTNWAGRRASGDYRLIIRFADRTSMPPLPLDWGLTLTVNRITVDNLKAALTDEHGVARLYDLAGGTYIALPATTNHLGSFVEMGEAEPGRWQYPRTRLMMPVGVNRADRLVRSRHNNVHGRVQLDVNKANLPGIIIVARDATTGAEISRTRSGPDGTFALNRVLSGDVRIVPMRDGLTFEPAEIALNGLRQDATAINFVASGTTVITGIVTHASGEPLSGVEVSLQADKGAFHGAPATYSYAGPDLTWDQWFEARKQGIFYPTRWTIFELDVETGGFIQDLSFRLHTTDGNETVILEHPDGTRVLVEDYNSEASQIRHFNDRFAPVRYSWERSEAERMQNRRTDLGPASPFARLFGKPAGGTWRLHLRPTYPRTHTLLSWSLEITPFEDDRTFTTITGADGRYQFRGLPPGFYQLNVSSDRFWLNPTNASLDTSITSPVAVNVTGESPVIDVVLQDNQGIAVSGIETRLEMDGRFFSAISDANGLARISHTQTGPGIIRVSAAANGLYSEPETIAVHTASGAVDPVHLTLLPVQTPEVAVSAPSFIWPATLHPEDLTTTQSIGGTFSFAPSGALALEPGSTPVNWTFTPDDQRRFRSVSGTVFVITTRATAMINAEDLHQIYDGSPRPATIITQPADLPVTVSYAGSSTPPTLPGSYPVLASVNTPYYRGTLQTTLHIDRAPVQLTFPEAVDGAIQRIFGEDESAVDVITDPSGFTPTIHFLDANNQTLPGQPVAIGAYRIIASVETPTHRGGANVDFRIVPVSIEVSFPEATNGIIERSFTAAPQSPVIAVTEPSGVPVQIVYEGNGYGPTENPPQPAGDYTVTATVTGETLSGAATATLRVLPAPLSMIATQPLDTFSAGDFLDLSTLFNANATNIQWFANGAPVDWLHDIIQWGNTPLAGAPVQALDYRATLFNGAALLPGYTGIAWNATQGRVLESAQIVATDVRSEFTAWQALDRGIVRVISVSDTTQFTDYQLPAGFAYNIRSLASGIGHAAVLSLDGELAVVAAADDPYELTAIPGALTHGGVAAIAAGDWHQIALTTSGVVYAWGRNDQGQINLPAWGDQTITAIGASPNGGIAITSSGDAITWGDAVAPTTGGPFTAAEGGAGFALYLGTDGRVYPTGNAQQSVNPPAAISNGIAAVRARGSIAVAMRPLPAFALRTAGELTLTAVVDDDANVLPGVTNFVINAQRQTPVIHFDDAIEGTINRVYSGAPVEAPVITTTPPDLPVHVVYNGPGLTNSPTPPVVAGEYTVTATIDHPRFAATVSRSLVVEKANATITLDQLDATFSGTPFVPVINTSPTGLTVTVTYNGQSTPPVEPGNYEVHATIIDANVTGSATATLTIARAPQLVAGTIPASYTFGGEPVPLIMETSAGLPVTHRVLEGPGTIDRDVLRVSASGEVVIEHTSAGNQRILPVSRIDTIHVARAAATIDLTLPVNPVYNAEPALVIITTEPEDLPVTVTFNGDEGMPVDAGTYAILATIDSPQYRGAASGTFTIARAPVNFIWSDLEQVWDGQQKTVGLVTEPSGLNVQIAYPVDRITPGTYPVTATAEGPNHFGSATAKLVIAKSPDVITFAPIPDASLDGAPVTLTATSRSGRAMIFNALDNRSRVIDNQQLQPLRAGRSLVRASHGAGEHPFYNSAAWVTQSVSIAGGTVDITLEFPSPPQVYNGSEHPVMAFSSDILKLANADIVVTYNGVTNRPVNAGIYAVIAEGANDSFSGIATGVLEIAKATPQIGIQTNAIFTGAPVLPGASITPDLPYELTFPGRFTPPVDAGTYPVRVIVETTNYAGTADFTLTIQPEDAFVGFFGTSLVYNGDDQFPGVNIVPSHAPVNYSITRLTEPAGPVDRIRIPGNYQIVASMASPNFIGGATTTVFMSGRELTFAAVPQEMMYTGEALRPAVSVFPANAPLVWNFFRDNQPVEAAINAGAYIAQISSSDPSFSGTTNLPFTILPAPAAVIPTNLTWTYTGLPQQPGFRTEPANLPVSLQMPAAITAGVYQVVATIANANYLGAVTSAFTIAKAPQTLSFNEPASPQIPLRGTVELAAESSAGLPVSFRLVSGPATLTGNSLTITGVAPVLVEAYVEESANHLAATPVPRSLIGVTDLVPVFIGDLDHTFDGLAKDAAVLTSPTGRAVHITYDGASAAPVNAGAYLVEAVVIAPGYEGYASATMTIAKAEASIIFDDLVTLYNDLPQSPSLQTAPTGLPVELTFNGSSEEPVLTGEYALQAMIVDSNYQGIVRATFEIQPGRPVILFPEIVDGVILRDYTGTPVDPVLVETEPAGLAVSMRYNAFQPPYDSATPPTEKGFYQVIARATGVNHDGEMTAPLIVGETGVLFDVPEWTGGALVRTYTGSPITPPTIEPSVPGTPYTVMYAGLANRGDSYGPSSTPPADAGNYTITIAPSASYLLGTRTLDLVIERAPRTLILNTPAQRRVGDQFDLNDLIGNDDTEGITVSWLSGPAQSLGGARYEISAAGIAEVRFTASQTANHLAAQEDVSFPIGGATFDLVFTDAVEGLITLTYTGEPVVINYTTDPVDVAIDLAFTGTNATGGIYGPTNAPPVDAGTYHVRARNGDLAYEGEAAVDLIIIPAAQTIAFDPSPEQRATNILTLAATASSVLRVTYEVLAGPATLLTSNQLVFSAAGEVIVNATQTGDANWLPAGAVTRTIAVSRAVAPITLTNLFDRIYTGEPHGAFAFSSPPLPVALTYNGAAARPVNAGVYTVLASVDTPAWEGATTGSLSILKAPASITLSQLGRDYSGTPLTPVATTVPDGLPVLFTFDGSPTHPVDSGIYTVVASIDHPNYRGSTTNIMSIAKANASIIVQDLIQTYDGTPKPLSVSTMPPGLPVELRYNGGTAVPTSAGSYAFLAYIDDHPNYMGSVTGTLVIAKASAHLFFTNTVQTYNGAWKIPGYITDPSDLGVTLTFNGNSDLPVDAGTYVLTGSILDPNYAGGATGSFQIVAGPAEIAFSATQTTYNAIRQDIPYSTSPGGLSVEVAYTVDGQTVEPVNAGTYRVEARIHDPNLAGFEVATFEILPAPADVLLTDAVDGRLIVDWTGEPIALPQVETTPPGLPVDFRFLQINGGTYDDSLPPAARGRYTLQAQISDPNYTGSATAELIIGPTTTVFTALDAVDGVVSRTYNGTPVTTPDIIADSPVAAWTITYTGTNNQAQHYGPSLTPPTDAGQYIAQVRGNLDASYVSGELNLELYIARASRIINPLLPTNTIIGSRIILPDLIPQPGNEDVQVELLGGAVTTDSYITWGNNVSAGLLNPPAALFQGVAHLALGAEGAVAVLSNGTVVTWGDAFGGVNNVPSGLTNIINVAAADYSRAALSADGHVTAWGFTFGNQTTPPPEIQGQVIDLAAGANHYIALLSNGTARIWGHIADGETVVPAELSDRTLVSVAAGGILTGAVDSEGRAHVWHPFFVTPTPSAAQSNVVELRVYDYTAVALRDDGSLVAWGDITTLPPEMQSGVVNFALGSRHLHAVSNDGSLISVANGLQANLTNAPVGEARAVWANRTIAMVLADAGEIFVGSLGNISIRITAPQTPNFLAYSGDFAMPVGKTPLAISFPGAPTNFIYNGTAQGLNVQTEPAGIAVSGWYLGTDNGGAFYGPSTNPPVNAGTYRLEAASAHPDYAGEAAWDFVIERAPQNISFAELENTYATEIMPLFATADSGLPVAFEVVAGPAATTGPTALAPEGLVFSAADFVTVQAVQAGNDNWLPAEPVLRELQVLKTPATITIGPRVPGNFGGIELEYTGEPQHPFVVTDPPDLAVNITFSGSTNPPVNIGQYLMEVTISDPAYSGTFGESFNIVPVTVTFSYFDLEHIYDGKAKSPGVITDPAGLPYQLVEAYAMMPIPWTLPTQAGTHDFAASMGFGGIYWGYDITNLVIRPRSVRAVLEVADKVFDGSTTATITGGSIIGAIPGDDVYLVASPTGVFATATTGSALPVTGSATLAGSDAHNYVISRVTASGNILRAPQTIVFPNPGDQFQTNIVNLAAAAASGRPVRYEVVSGPAAIIDGDKLVFNGTGQVILRAIETGSHNWDPAPPVEQSISVLQVDRTIQAIAQGPGSIHPAGTVSVAYGASQRFDFTPDPWHRVDTVIINGNAIGAMSSYDWSNIIDDGTITVRFAPVPVEVDLPVELPQAWMAQYGLTNDMAALAFEDLDGDGVPTWREYIMDTDPTDPDSVLYLNATSVADGHSLMWPASTARVYALYRGTNLMQGITNRIAADLVPDASGQIHYADDTPAMELRDIYYRIRVDLPSRED